MLKDTYCYCFVNRRLIHLTTFRHVTYFLQQHFLLALGQLTFFTCIIDDDGHIVNTVRLYHFLWGDISVNRHTARHGHYCLIILNHYKLL